MTTAVAEEATVSVDELWSRDRLEQLLSPLLAPACVERVWAEAWGALQVSPATLTRWLRRFGNECAALAVAAGLTDHQLTEQLDRKGPDRAVLEMLADLNCYPYVTPAARPVTPAPWARYL